MLKLAGAFALGALVATMIGLILERLTEGKAHNSIGLKEITETDRKAYQSLTVSVFAGNKVSSGCVLDDGTVSGSKKYLTSLHGIGNALLDRDEIFVNNEKAKVIGQGRTDESDYAVLTTDLSLKAKNVELPEHKFKIGDDLVISGNPGQEISLVQSAKVINDSKSYKKENEFISHKAVYTLYVEKGISGSCVYPANSFIPVAVFTKEDPDDPSRIGRISLVSKTIE